MKAFIDHDHMDMLQDQNLCTRLLNWYNASHRDLPWRKTGNPYAIWVSEVMLQQTQVKTVIPYYERFLQRFPSVNELAAADLEDVLMVWSGLGYYSRARRLWEGANYILQHLNGQMPGDYDGLLRIPGIGDYTAGAIASIAFGQRIPAIDGNVKRVLSRLLAWNEPVETVRSLRRFKERLLAWQSVENPGDFNQALMELGAMVCTAAKSACGCCPLADVCRGFLGGEALLYPLKKPKTRRKDITRLTFVLRKGNKIYVQKRPAKGLLAGLWEFPGSEIEDSDGQSPNDGLPDISRDEYMVHFQKALADRGFDLLAEEQFRRGVILHGPIWYTFSHRRWKIIWVIIDLPEPRSPFPLRETEGDYSSNSKDEYSEISRWVSLENSGQTPLPVAFSGIYESLQSELTSSLQELE
ncbi:A/G-specific adenine glycosylase [Desulfosporosinus orientis DSM 765]|uniref:Adenine DNA glycosylase n=1 Tax=Desulfosporosinus orientis (strain ATCC 19365 / DSM 765 / NCIMB 8382 / VKM B-1628 / Singapore I) TaxID=768706 RepID=G7WCM4_DESOD|nr:A/G-specific adenine glycosylase [Desulfosporosinus orientis]AET66562.1 A/G-specific adenine glycosylase [Desulfosporosinus orientis DSM 765]